MKKLRRTMAMLLSLLMIGMFMGCAGKESDPIEVMEAAQQKNSQLTSSDLTMTMDMAFSTSGLTMDMALDMDCKAVGSGEDTQLAMTGNVSAMGMELPMEMYYTDGYMYTNVLEQKVKQAMSLENAEEQIMTISSIGPLPQEAYKSLTMEEDGDNQVISFTADGTQMTDLVTNLLSQFENQLGESGTYTIGDVTGTLTVNGDGYVASETLSIPLTMTVPDMGDMEMTMDCAITNHNPGQEVTISFPDFSDYIETDLSDVSEIPGNT